MLDQIQSHGQLIINISFPSLPSASFGAEEAATPHSVSEQRDLVNFNRSAELQEDVMSLTGGALGKAIRTLLTKSLNHESRPLSFSCPLDEALTRVMLDPTLFCAAREGALTAFTLPPYGPYGKKNEGERC